MEETAAALIMLGLIVIAFTAGRWYEKMVQESLEEWRRKHSVNGRDVTSDELKKLVDALKDEEHE